MIVHFITHSSLRKLAWDSFAKVCFKKGEASGGREVEGRLKILHL